MEEATLLGNRNLDRATECFAVCISQDSHIIETQLILLHGKK